MQVNTLIRFGSCSLKVLIGPEKHRGVREPRLPDPIPGPEIRVALPTARAKFLGVTANG
jgi:hypothetical protein